MRYFQTLIFLVLLILVGTVSSASAAQRMRGMWVWNAPDVIQSQSLQSQFKTLVISSGISDLFLCLGAADYSAHQNELRAFNSSMRSVGIRTWGLDGSRAYFSDEKGPANLYASVDALIRFNQRVAPTERFVGFQADMEPQDQKSFKPTFHNDFSDSKLSTTGGGVWYATQALDREMLMRDWLTIHQTISQRLKRQHLLFGAALVFWTSNFHGSEVQVTFNGVRQCVMKFMMDFLTDYIVMTYNTDPKNAASRLLPQLIYADTLPANRRPRVYGSMETNVGVGQFVSYGDTPPKNNRTSVMADLVTIESILSSHPSFSGMSLEDWTGWSKLSP